MQNAVAGLVMLLLAVLAAGSSRELETFAEKLLSGEGDRVTAMAASKYAVCCALICVGAVCGLVYHVKILLFS